MIIIPFIFVAALLVFCLFLISDINDTTRVVTLIFSGLTMLTTGVITFMYYVQGIQNGPIP